MDHGGERGTSLGVLGTGCLPSLFSIAWLRQKELEGCPGSVLYRVRLCAARVPYGFTPSARGRDSGHRSI